MVINNYRSPLTTDVEVHLIDTSSVNFLRPETSFDAVWEFSQTRKSAEEVAVTQASLVDVVRLNAI